VVLGVREVCGDGCDYGAACEFFLFTFAFFFLL
jgi:hypothetical protein